MSLAETLQAVYRLRQQPMFSLAVVAVLALAIGANTAMFTLVHAILLKPLPLRDPTRLVTITLVRPGNDRQPLSLPDLADLRSGMHTLEEVTALFGWSANVTGSGDAERLQGVRVLPNYFEVTGAAVAIGRPLLPSDEAQAVALLGHALWQRRFGGDPDVLGRSLVLNGERFEIVGILRPDFVSPVRDAEVVAPFSPATDPRRANRAQGFLRVMGRIREDVSIRQVSADLAAVVGRMRTAFPDSHGTDTGGAVRQLHEEVSGRAAPMLRLLLAAVGLVLLVACANLANLFLVRDSSRRRELAIRAALGASRRRIVVQLVTEAAILAVLGGALGLLLAEALVRTLIAIGPTDLPRVAEVRLDLRASFATLLISAGACLLFGVGPALHASRGDLRDALKGGDRALAGGSHRIRTWLIFVEVTLSTVLLLTSALLARSFQHVQAVDPGFRPAHTLTIRLSLPRARYRDRAAIAAFYDQLQPRIASLPGVRVVAASNVVPMNGYLATTTFQIDGLTGTDRPDVHYRMISPDYFRALGVALRQGRPFTSADRSDAQAVAIVNETFAAQYLGGVNPIGARVQLDDGEESPRTVHVVGVVANVKHFGLEREATLELYVPIAQVPDPTTIWLANNMYWVIQTDGEPLAATNAVRREIQSVDPNVPASFVRSMDQWMAASLAPRRFNLQLVGAFAMAALLLAVVGVYAVSAAAVAARTREIGIRAALGASRRGIMRLVLRGALVPVLLGVVAGSGAAALSGRALRGVLFGVTVGDPASLTFTAVTLICAAVLASYVPARRAAEVDPLEAIRVE